MPSCLKKKLKDGMIKEFRNENLILVIKFFCTSLVSDILLGKLLSKWEGPYIIKEVYHSGAIKINNAEGNKPKVVNGQRLKHYIAGVGAKTGGSRVGGPELVILARW